MMFKLNINKVNFCPNCKSKNINKSESGNPKRVEVVFSCEDCKLGCYLIETME